ncbi:DUF294 nucleotidyltransferase-like domain-containing protein [Heyndrickxia vini]|nr:DUF294 nucleotidyltransferase-like domain-containing protein [Heyndrickxia vini]
MQKKKLVEANGEGLNESKNSRCTVGGRVLKFLMNEHQSLVSWKNNYLFKYFSDNRSLNLFHDQVMKKAFQLSINQIGPPPCSFSWFVMGSSGRSEQGIFSDQDHGLVFEDNGEKNMLYFRHLGKELTDELYRLGYSYCEGKVMSSNILWCRSYKEWEEQINGWIEQGSWESIRNATIFFDSRNLVGNDEFIEDLKRQFLNKIVSNPKVLERFFENIRHVRNSVGLFGQIFVETKGIHQGEIDLKSMAYLPYVNAIRYLAIKEGVYETSTILRMNALSKMTRYEKDIPIYQRYFKKLLAYRLSLINERTSCQSMNYINVKNIEREKRKEIKEILHHGKRLHRFIETIAKGL